MGHKLFKKHKTNDIIASQHYSTICEWKNEAAKHIKIVEISIAETELGRNWIKSNFDTVVESESIEGAILPIPEGEADFDRQIMNKDDNEGIDDKNDAIVQGITLDG